MSDSMYIRAKPVLLEVTWVSILLCVLCCHGVEHMCACRVCMRVSDSVCQEGDERSKKAQKAESSDDLGRTRR